MARKETDVTVNDQMPPDGVAVASGGRLIGWVPGRLRNPLNGPHQHWVVKARERKGWRERTLVVMREAMRRTEWNRHHGAMEPKLVVLTAYVWNLYDEDGLAAALKPVVDGLVDAGVMHSDKHDCGHKIEKRQQINRRHRGVEVVVEPKG